MSTSINASLIDKDEDFPYVSTWSTMSPQAMFKNLVDYHYTTTPLNLEKIRDRIPIKYKKSFSDGISFETKDTSLDEYLKINAITDFFTEKIRLSTSKRKFMTSTPIEMWKSNKKEITELSQEKYGDTSPYHLRLTAFTFTKESVNFRPTIALSMYKYFHPSSILDISSGWGDRLIGSLAYATHIEDRNTPGIGTQAAISFERYIGFDPNINLQTCYNDIVRTFLPEGMKPQQFHIFPEPFENSAKILKDLGLSFDFVFSSIPYFDLELYDIGTSASEGKAKQSTVKYEDINRWILSFLIPAIRISARFLREDGHLAINMEGQFVTLFFEKYDHFISTEGLTYEGIIGYQSDDPKDLRVHPTYVWKKRCLCSS